MNHVTNACSRDNILRACGSVLSDADASAENATAAGEAATTGGRQTNTNKQKDIPRGTVLRLAQSCRVSQGLWRLYPFSLLQRRTRLCAKLLQVDTKKTLAERLSTSLDAQVLEFMRSLGDKERVEDSLFDGIVEHGIFGLMYLLQRFPDQVCVALPKLRARLSDIVTREFASPGLGIQWSDFCLYWGPPESGEGDAVSLALPAGSLDEFRDLVRGCLASSASRRFYLSALILVSADRRAGHANLVMFDTATGLLERFEPYQAQIRTFRTLELDQALAQTFQAVFPTEFVGFVRPPNLEIAARRGLQFVAEQEGKQPAYRGVISPQGRKVTKGNPYGYCLTWSYNHAAARLALRNQDPTTLPELYALTADLYGLDWTQLIRNVADELYREKQKLVLELLLVEEGVRSGQRKISHLTPELFSHQTTYVRFCMLALQHLDNYLRTL